MPVINHQQKFSGIFAPSVNFRPFNQPEPAQFDNEIKTMTEKMSYVDKPMKKKPLPGENLLKELY